MKPFKNLISIGLLALGVLSFTEGAQAAAAESQAKTNAIFTARVSNYRNYGAAFNVIQPGYGRASIDTLFMWYWPTNTVALQTVTYFTGDVTPLTTVTNAGASGDSAILVGSTNGLFATEKCVLQVNDAYQTCLLLSVSNVISGSNYVAFVETLGIAVPVGSVIYPMNVSNVFTTQNTNTFWLPNCHSARKGWPLLVMSSGAGVLNVTHQYNIDTAP